MLKLVESLDKTRYTPRAYAVAATDKMSGKKAAGLEATIAEAKVGSLLGDQDIVMYITR